jgi:hypothetical protein
MKKGKRIKKTVGLLAFIIICFLALRFLLTFWGETAECSYIYAKSFFLFGIEATFAVYSFSAGIPFFGITLTEKEMLLNEIRFLPIFPFVSGEAGIVEFDWGEAGFITVLIILIIGIISAKAKRLPAPEKIEDDEDEEEIIEDKNLCRKCGKRLLDNHVYCENCGAKRED